MNHERWLVSYADFITLLFAFFVVMFASSQVDKRKIAAMAATFDSYAAGGAQASRGNSRPAPSAQAAEAAAPSSQGAAPGLTMAELEPSRDRLAAVLHREITSGEVEISLEPRGLVLSLKDSAFFAPGDDAVSPEARPILAKVAQALRQVPGEIRLEGHTDDRPIHSGRFPSNWQLSTARSIAVLKVLTGELGFPPERLAVAGYGEYQPLESNETESGRRKNRRVDLVVLTQEAASMAPS
ncbi:MAG TPA: OmpA family protein [Bryobacterales bacterium]|jgi:chemotaxis protein MotB|nr:OmpA family protein [Bryobacterales bacterium]